MFYASVCKLVARVHLFASDSRLVSPFCFHLLEGTEEKKKRERKAVFIYATLFIGSDIRLRGCSITQTCTPGRGLPAQGSVTGKQPPTMTKWAWASFPHRRRRHIAAIMVNVVAVVFITPGEDKCCWLRLNLLGSTSFSVTLGFVPSVWEQLWLPKCLT